MEQGKKDMAERTKALRKKLGLNQTEFAKVVGEVDQATVSKWERGLQKPNGERALKLAELSEQSASKLSDPSAGRLTTHVLDTASGKPAGGLKIALYRVSGNSHRLLKTVETNADGRCDAPLLEGADFKLGQYELIFFAGDYLRAAGATLPDPAFLDQVPIRFGLAEQTHYHVPLLISPYGYSTYRGS